MLHSNQFDLHFIIHLKEKFNMGTDYCIMTILMMVSASHWIKTDIIYFLLFACLSLYLRVSVKAAEWVAGADIQNVNVCTRPFPIFHYVKAISWFFLLFLLLFKAKTKRATGTTALRQCGFLTTTVTYIFFWYKKLLFDLS